jgi:hypothetical protein
MTVMLVLRILAMKILDALIPQLFALLLIVAILPLAILP